MNTNVVEAMPTPSFTDFRENIGKDADWNNYPIDIYIRRQVIVRHVWILNSTEIPWITNIFLKKANSTEIMDFINHDHEYRDRLEFSKKLWDIEWIDMAQSTVEDAIKSKSDEEFLLSFRENTIMNLLVVIIKRVRNNATIKPYIKSIAY